MAKAKVKGKPNIVLTLSGTEAEILMAALSVFVTGDLTDPIYEALDVVGVGTGKYDVHSAKKIENSQIEWSEVGLENLKVVKYG